MNDAERIWREKSDDDLLDAAAELDQFTADGQRIIREELKRRGLEDPMAQAGLEDEGEDAGEEEDAPLECLRCRTPLRLIDPEAEDAEWRLLGQRLPQFDPRGQLHAYACPSCGHIELFINPAV